MDCLYKKRCTCQKQSPGGVLSLRPATLLKKRLRHWCFPVNFCEISKNTVFNRTPLVAASVENTVLLFAAVS